MKCWCLRNLTRLRRDFLSVYLKFLIKNNLRTLTAELIIYSLTGLRKGHYSLIWLIEYSFDHLTQIYPLHC